MENRLKVFFIVSRFPYPLIKGDKLRAYYQIKGLSEFFDIYLCALSDETVPESSFAALKPFCKEIMVHHLKWFPLILNVIRYFFFSGKPVQTGYFHNHRIKKNMLKDIQRINPDHIFCQLIRTVSYVKNIHSIGKTLDYMDSLSLGMERRAEYAGGLMKKVLNIEANRLKQFEHDIFKDFDNSIIISESDRVQIFHYDNESIKVVPNGIDTAYFNEVKAEKKFDILFTGNMSYPPNIHSAIYLVREIMPLVWKVRPETKLLISGANPVAKVRALATERVTVKGWIKDLRVSYVESRIFLAPMQIGSGLQNKLLEAMAMKIPCIASALANKSLGAVHGESILIGYEPAEYALHVIDLLENIEKASEMAEKGHSFVTRHFNWSTSNEYLRQIISNGKT